MLEEVLVLDDHGRRDAAWLRGLGRGGWLGLIANVSVCFVYCLYS